MYIVHYTLSGKNGETYETKSEYDVDSKEQAVDKVQIWNEESTYWSMEIEKIIESKYE